MNKKNLILTNTVGMPRETWLEFRQPLTHIKRFIRQFLNLEQEHYPTYGQLKTVFASKEWSEFIFPCVGGSEVATVMGLNPYKSSIELYFEKNGAKEVYDFDNVAMFWGRELEEQIAEKWQYWDGSGETLIENYKNKNILRRCRRMNAYVQHKSYPWLFVSLDRVINKQKNGEEVLNEGCLECKTISGYSADMWESGIPVMYVAQLQAQLIATDTQFGEIAILKDGRYFEVYPFDRHQEICNKIIELTKQFFEIVKISAAQFLLHMAATDDALKQDHYAEVDKWAPEPDGSVSYKNYLSERYAEGGPEGITGGIVELEHAKEYKYFAAQIKNLETLQLERSNRLKAILKDNSKLDFGAEGYVSWKNDAKGTRRFLVQVKIDNSYKPDMIKPTIEQEMKNETAVVVEDLPFIKEEEATPRKKKPSKKVVEESDRGE